MGLSSDLAFSQVLLASTLVGSDPPSLAFPYGEELSPESGNIEEILDIWREQRD